jgi:hypothetical protein
VRSRLDAVDHGVAMNGPPVLDAVSAAGSMCTHRPPRTDLMTTNLH